MCFLHLLQFVRSIISNLPWMRDEMSIEKVMFAFCFCFCFLLWSDVCYYSFYKVNVIKILDLPPLIQILDCQSIITGENHWYPNQIGCFWTFQVAESSYRVWLFKPTFSKCERKVSNTTFAHSKHQSNEKIAPMKEGNNNPPLVPVHENYMLKRQNNGKGVKATSDD